MANYIKKQQIWFENNTEEYHIHGKNILAKIKNYRGKGSNIYKKAIHLYKRWKLQNENIMGSTLKAIKNKVRFLNNYMDKISEIEIFSSQSKYHSSVLEEFFYYLFSDLINNINRPKRSANKIMLGGIRAYSNLYFAPKSIYEFKKTSSIKVNVKDQDFSIYRNVKLTAEDIETTLNVPVVSIECKTYIDKTMLEGSIATAEKIKNGNPYCLFIVVAETYSVSFDVDPAYSRIDQIYILRKSKDTSKSSKIDYHVVCDLFKYVKKHISRDWSNIKNKLLNNGKII
jgi:hypothetical protein